MNLKIIKNANDHAEALKRLDELFDLDPIEGSKESNELDVLALLIEQYEMEKFPIDKPTPIEAIKFRMDQQGLKAKDLVPYIGSAPKVSEVLNNKRSLSLSMIRKLSEGLDIVMLVKISDSEDRGHLSGRVPLKTKGVVECVYSDCVSVDGLIWYFDEIKLVVRGGVLKKPKKVVKNNDYETYTGDTGYYIKSYFNDGFHSW